MNNNFDFDFWKREFKRRFELNEITGQMLDNFIYYNPEMAKRYIIDVYQQKVYKCDILDKYCDRYDSEKINSILKQIEFDELTEEEIQEYEIKKSEEEENQELWVIKKILNNN